MPASAAIRTVDLAPFFTDGDEAGRKKVKDTIAEACADYGFFQIVNHGIPLDLMDQAIELSRTFFDYPEEMKHASTEGADKSLLAGYFKQPDTSVDKNEYVIMYTPESPFNVVPTNPPDFRKTFEEVFKYFLKTCQILEEIINECLDLPPNFLKEFNSDRSWDYLVASRYPPATENENAGVSEHEDGNLITLIVPEDNVGGLEVCKDGEWIPVIPTRGKVAVNISNVIQVLSNKKFRSATHRVLRQEGKNRHSLGFFYNLLGDKWVEPLPKFTTDIGVKPKYKGFYYKDYIALRVKDELSYPPTKPEDLIRITHYEI